MIEREMANVRRRWHGTPCQKRTARRLEEVSRNEGWSAWTGKCREGRADGNTRVHGARTSGVTGPPDVDSGNRRGAGSGPEAPPAHSHVNPARSIRMPTRPKERASAPTHRIAKVANVQRALRREGERPHTPNHDQTGDHGKPLEPGAH